MSKDLLISIVFHVMIVVVTLFISPLEYKPNRDLGEVIRVSAVSMAEISPVEQPTIAPVVEPPAALEIEPMEIPVEDPISKPEVEIEKPVEPPEPKEEPKPDPPKPKPSRPTGDVEPQAADVNQAGTEDGSREVETPAGSLISGMRVDNTSFDHPYWFNLAQSKIDRSFRNTVPIDGKVYCDVYFQVIKSGRVIEVEVKSSSGIPRFDQICVDAIERSAPFPPLPRKFLDEIIGITITLTNQ